MVDAVQCEGVERDVCCGKEGLLRVNTGWRRMWKAHSIRILNHNHRSRESSCVREGAPERCDVIGGVGYEEDWVGGVAFEGS